MKCNFHFRPWLPGALLMAWLPVAPLLAQDLAFSRKEEAGGRSAATQQATFKPLREVLNQLEDTYKVNFAFSEKLIEHKTVDVNRMVPNKLEKTLQSLLTPLQLKYKRISKELYVIQSVTPEAPAELNNPETPQPDREQRPDNSSVDPAQLREGQPGKPGNPAPVFALNGKVTAVNGEALPGVNVLLKGTTLGTVTDANGAFSLNVPDESANGTLIISYVGYVTQEVLIARQTTIQVSLAPDVKSLSEVVVVGYGTQQRKDVTGSIASVSSKELNQLPITNLQSGLQGRATGVNVTNDSGEPGAGVRVQIRGVGTINGTDPLYVVDGVPIVGGTNTLNTLDIASIEVLKDASAGAIYGSRAANGVVLITTRKGASGKPKFNFDAYYGLQSTWRRMDLLNARQLGERSNEGNRNAGLPNVPIYNNLDSLEAAVGQGTDWQKEMFQTAPIQNYNLSVSGGSDKGSYLFSGGYQKQDGIMRGTGFERIMFRVNTEAKFNRLKIGENLSLGRTTKLLPAWGGGGNAIQNVIKQSPHVKVYNPANEGGYGGSGPTDNLDAGNPVGLEALIDDKDYNNRLLGNVYASLEIVKGLTFNTNLGADISFGRQHRFTPTFFMDKGVGNFSDKARVYESNSTNFGITTTNTLTYAATLGKHNFSVLAGAEQQSTNYESFGSSGEGFPDNNTVQISNGATRSGDGAKYERAIRSFFGRVNYEFAGKYLLTANIRRDGSSNFGRNYRYGVFPSASVGWRVSEEPFLANVAFLSDLKLRASWGQLGNQEGIPNYAYASRLTASGAMDYVFNNTKVSGIAPSGLANPDLRWETVTQTDIGLDLGLFQNALVITADYYHRLTKDVLVTGIPTPATSGVSTAPPLNAGDVRNMGIELGITYRKTVGDFQYSIGGNITTIQNKVLKLGKGEPITSGGFFDNKYITRTEEGRPIGAFYGYQVDRIFRSQEDVNQFNRVNPTTGDTIFYQPGAAPGDIKFKDLNNDGVVNSKDRTYLGSPIPDFFYGINATASYKGFDFSLFIQGVHGNKIYNANRLWLEGMTRNFNSGTAVLNRWRSPVEPGDGKVPRAVSTDPNQNNRESDRYLENGSYMRIKNVQLGYSLPASVLKNLGGLANFRIYASCQNLLTITNYSGFDPEIGGDNLSRGIDTGVYPQARTFLLGVQVGF